MLRILTTIFILALSLASGQGVRNPARKGEFPGLNLLPAGSVIQNISLPRFEGHRVASHLLADRLQIISPRLVKLTGVRSSMFALTGEVTTIELENADYDFETEQLSTDKPVRLVDPRFQAEGAAAIFSTPRQEGLVRGPVTTLIHTEILQSAPPRSAKTPPAP